MLLHNQTDATHSNMLKAFLVPFEIMLIAYKKLTTDHCFVKTAVVTHFRLFGMENFPVFSASLKIPVFYIQ
jgi:hypothetical protein